MDPYAHTTADKILWLRLHHENINQIFNRHFIDNVHSKVSFKTDKLNYIEPSFRFDNPDFTVVFMGESTTECAAVQEKKRFPFLISKYLEAKGLKVNTLNIARGGGTLHDSINILFNHVVLNSPNAIVLMHAVNDIGVLKKGKPYQSRMGHDIGLNDIAKYSLQLLSIHFSIGGFLREKATVNNFLPIKIPQNSHCDKCKVDPKPFIARLKIFIAMCQAFDIIPVLVTEPLAIEMKNELTPAWTDENCQKLFNNCIREVSKNNNVDLIDLSLLISKVATNTDKLRKIFYDGIHVTDYGSKLYASYISENLYKILNKKNLKHK